MQLLEMLTQAGLVALLSLAVVPAPMVMGVLYAIRPSEARLALMRPLALASIFASLCGFLSGLVHIFHNLGANPSPSFTDPGGAGTFRGARADVRRGRMPHRGVAMRRHRAQAAPVATRHASAITPPLGATPAFSNPHVDRRPGRDLRLRRLRDRRDAGVPHRSPARTRSAPVHGSRPRPALGCGHDHGSRRPCVPASSALRRRCSDHLAADLSRLRHARRRIRDGAHRSGQR